MPESEQLILYYRNYCGFCTRVKKVIDKLNVNVELRNIWDDDSGYDELEAAMGRATVPVLRMVNAEGQSRWMPESTEIVGYLVENYGPDRKS